ncbi:MAG: outer membrane beta-barrel protein [Candidatus Acidiferrales bacterium]
MKKLIGLLGLVALFSLPTLAQDTPAFEVNGGYTFRSWDTPDSPRFKMNGWNAGADFNVNHWLGAVASFDGTYNHQSADLVNNFPPVDTSIYTYLFGPRVYPLGHHKLTPFAQALFGGGHVRAYSPAYVCGDARRQRSGTGGTCPALTETDDRFAFSFGAGLDVSLGSHWAVRLAQVDYERTGFFGSGSQGAPYQNNFKYSAGIVYRIGQR